MSWHGMGDRLKPVLKKERYRKAHELRQQGKTFRQIGGMMGISMQRAHEMVTRYENESRRSEPHS